MKTIEDEVSMERGGLEKFQKVINKLRLECDSVKGTDIASKDTEVRRIFRYLWVVLGLLKNRVRVDTGFEKKLKRVQSEYKQIQDEDDKQLFLNSVAVELYALRGEMESYLDALGLYPEEEVPTRTVTLAQDGKIEGLSKAVPGKRKRGENGEED